MTELLDSGGLRLAGYFAAAVASIVAGQTDRRLQSNHVDDGRWPTFWFVGSVLLVAMGVARAGDLADIISEAGRDGARSGDWYEIRRSFQVVIVGTISAIWSLSVLVAIWRVPERRRRYLPAAIALSTLPVFAAIRIVSLHHIDAVLYRHDLAGVRLVAIAELTLLVAAVTTMFWFPFVDRADPTSRPPDEP